MAKKATKIKLQKKPQTFTYKPAIVYKTPIRIDCRKYLASKGYPSHHMDAMITYAKNKGFSGKMLVPEWEEIFRSY